MRITIAILMLSVAVATFFGCHAELRKSDAELGLTPSQAIGRHIYDQRCGSCHEAYSSRPLKGPSLQRLFKHEYMQNGMPANDERVRQIVDFGRAKMPGFNQSLTPQQTDELMDYLHTL